MSRIAEKPCVVPFDPWSNISSGTSNTEFGAIPANGAQPSSGTGAFDPGLVSIIGQKFETSDGRELVLVRAGATAVAQGKVYQGPAQITGHLDLAITVPAATPATAGTFQILVTNGATVVNQDYYQGGYLIVSDNTGEGFIYRISTHQAAAASATFTVTLQDPIQTTLDATTTVSLLKNPYDFVIINAHTSTTSAPVGVSLNGIAASTAATYNATTGVLTTNGTAQYGFLVCHGPTAGLIDTTTNVGYGLGTSVNVDGALEVQTLTASPMIALSMQTQVDTEYGLVYVLL